MKKLLFAVSAFYSIFLMSCNNNGNSGNDNNLSASRDIIKGIETGDSTKLSSIAPDAVDHAGPTGDVTNGDSIKGYLLEMHNHIKDLKMKVRRFEIVIGTDLSVRIRWQAVTQVGVSIKADDRVRYSEGAEDSLHSRVRYHWADRSRRKRPFLVFCFLASDRHRFHVAQWRRDVELYYLHDAAILSADHGLLAGLCRRRSRLRKQDNCNCRKAQHHADQDTQFEERGLRSGFLFHWMECGVWRL